MSDLATSNFVKRIRCLIVDPVSSNRNAYVKVLKTFGVTNDRIRMADSFASASEELDAFKPTLMIAEHDLGDGGTGINLVGMQRKEIPNRLEIASFLVSGNNSPMVATYAAEAEVDKLIVKPFTYDSLTECFQEVLKEKAFPDEALFQIEEARTKIAEDQIDQGLSILEKVNVTRENSGSVHCLMGRAKLKKSDREGAITAFEAALRDSPLHYHSLATLLDLFLEDKNYEQAFRVLQQMSEAYPISPRRIPQVIRLFVMTERYEDILEYFDVLTAIDTEDKSVNKAVTAGLMTCGKSFLNKGRSEEALVAFRKAENYGLEKEKIRKGIICMLLRAGLGENAKPFLNRAEKASIESPEVQIAEVFHLDKTRQDAGQTVQMGLRLIQRNIYDADLFLLVIRRSIDFNRRREVVLQLIDEAANRFPDRKEEFNALSQAFSADPK